MAAYPYFELAEVLEEKLRPQRYHDHRNDGVVIFASEDEERAVRKRASELRRLGRLDLDEGTYPLEDES